MELPLFGEVSIAVVRERHMARCTRVLKVSSEMCHMSVLIFCWLKKVHGHVLLQVGKATVSQLQLQGGEAEHLSTTQLTVMYIWCSLSISYYHSGRFAEPAEMLIGHVHVNRTPRMSRKGHSDYACVPPLPIRHVSKGPCLTSVCITNT